MTTLLHQHGLGDWLMFEKFFANAERAALRSIYWQTVSADVAIALMRACPAYSRVEHHVATSANLDECRAATPTAPLFTGIQHRKYTGGSFTKGDLDADMRPLCFPWTYDYIVIQASTPFNGAEQRKSRDMQAEDWDWVISELERRDLYAHVLNSEGAADPPRHPLIDDLQGTTTPAQSAQILRGAVGYWGIDSWLAILAAELFPPEALQIRTRNTAVVGGARQVYAPQTDFPFLVPTLGATPYLAGSIAG